MLCSLLSFVNTYLIGAVLPPMLFLCGGFFIWKSHGFPFRCPKKIINTLLGGKSVASSFSALTLALAGTLGVGNITGVAAAIAAGGAGALFWMWMAAVVAMVIKCCEIILAVKYRIRAEGRFIGGAMYYMKSKFAARSFAVFCLLTAFTMGSILQVKAASDASLLVFGIDRQLFGLLFALPIFAVICGGVNQIKHLTARLIPLLTLFYVGLSLLIILQNRSALPAVIGEIFESAFGLRQAVGGIGGTAIARAIRYGVTRGLITNESGCGTAPMAHAGAERATPAEQGIWGIIEVFVDTVLLCTLTGLALLTSSADLNDGSMAAVLEAFSGAGFTSTAALAISISLFAFATVICWYYYGGEALAYLDQRGRLSKFYPLLFTLVCALGAGLSEKLVWQCADLTVGVMTLINLTALFKRRQEILNALTQYAKKPRSKLRG